MRKIGIVSQLEKRKRRKSEERVKAAIVMARKNVLPLGSCIMQQEILHIPW